jgi:hypothetical protein
VKGWLLDTNVVAELGRPQAARRLVAWAQAQPEARLFIGVLTLGEYEKGLAYMPPSAPGRARLEAAVRALETRFAGRVLSLSDAIVRRWGRISGLIKRATGQSPPVIDVLLAATAIEHGLYLVTRNVRDVAHSGASVFNPWQDDLERFPLS